MQFYFRFVPKGDVAPSAEATDYRPAGRHFCFGGIRSTL